MAYCLKHEINWKEIFVKYVGIVGEHEGVDFLGDYEWTSEEWEAIQEALNEQR